MGDRPQGPTDLLDARGAEHEGIPPRKDDLPDLGMGRDIGQSRGKTCTAQRRILARADHLATKAKAAIDRAGRNQLEQRPVTIAVNEARGHQVAAIIDGVGALFAGGDQLITMGEKLRGNGIGRILRIDQAFHDRGDGHGITGGHARKSIVSEIRPGFRWVRCS